VQVRDQARDARATRVSAQHLVIGHEASHEVGDDKGAGGSDDGASHEVGDDKGAGGSDDGASHEASHEASDDKGTGGGSHSGKGSH
jgi:hypothetical protein